MNNCFSASNSLSMEGGPVILAIELNAANWIQAVVYLDSPELNEIIPLPTVRWCHTMDSYYCIAFNPKICYESTVKE